MADSRQHVLVVGAKKAGLERVAPMLRRADFSVHSVEPSPFLLDLVLSTAFELVIVTYPLDTLPLDDLIDTIRDAGSACHDAGLLLLAEPEQLDDAQSVVDLGANRAICCEWSEARLWQAIGDLMEVAPRIFMRVLMHADIELKNDTKPRDFPDSQRVGFGSAACRAPIFWRRVRPSTSFSACREVD